MRISTLVMAVAVSAVVAACGGQPDAAMEVPLSSSGSAVSTAGSLDRAAGTALKAVPGSSLTSIETEGPGWEVQVVTSDGTERELMVTGDGAKVTQNEPKQEGKADKDKHRKRIKAAKLDYRAAAKTMLTAVPDTSITELNLDTYRGVTVWEGDLEDSKSAKHEVKIDAASGKVLVK